MGVATVEWGVAMVERGMVVLEWGGAAGVVVGVVTAVLALKGMNSTSSSNHASSSSSICRGSRL